MKHRNDIIKRVMKLPKRIYIAAAVLLFMGGAGTALALRPEPAEPKKVSVEQVSSVAPQQDQTAASLETQTTTEQTQTTAATAVSTQEAPPSVTNPFGEGSSAWYVFNRRAEVGKVMTANYTTERSFCNSLTSTGQPVQQAIACKTVSGSSHMMFVEQVNGDGSIWVSEMNSKGQVSMTDTTPTGGWDTVDYRLVTVEQLSLYKFVQ